MLSLCSLQVSIVLNKCLSQKAMTGNLGIQNNAFDSPMEDAVTLLFARGRRGVLCMLLHETILYRLF